jgi:anti-anti-sigma regulatory factor
MQEGLIAMRGNDNSAAEDGALLVTRTCGPPGLAIAGEIDESNYADLIGAPAAIADWPDCEVHINLSGVTYCDLAGLRTIIRVATGRDRAVGLRRAVLHAVSPELTAVLRILGWDKIPGLAISERTSGAPQPLATGAGLRESTSR